jgi:hypothetical protein
MASLSSRVHRPAQVRPAAGEIDSCARGGEGDGKKTNLYPHLFFLLTFT